MANYQIAIIKANKFIYSESDRTFSKLSHENVQDNIEDYIELKSIDCSNMMEEIMEILNMPDSVAHTVRCHETDEYIYELCYHSDLASSVNNIATHLSKFTDRVIGNAILIKSKINYDSTCSLVNISLSDVADIYRKIFVHTGIIVGSNGSIDEYPFIFNPIDLIKPDQLENMKFYEFKIFDKVIQMFIELNPVQIENNTNELASILYGENLINGKVRFAMRYTFDDAKMTESEYCELTKDTFHKLLCYSSDLEICNDRIKNTNNPQPNQLDESTQPTEKTKKLTSFHTYLKNKYNEYKEKYGTEPKREVLDKLKDLPTLQNITVELSKSNAQTK